MTKIIVSVKKPEGKITESDLFKATRGIRMNGTELGIIPNGDHSLVEFKSRSKDKAWDVYHDFRKAYTSRIFKLEVNTGKNSTVLFDRA